MSYVTGLILLLVASAIVNNVVLSQFLGLCPFLGVSKRVETAAGMGGAVIFVITIASFVTSLIYKFILAPTGFEYMQTIVFILVIAALVQFVEMFLKKSVPSLYQSLGVYLPLITTNCAVLGTAINNVTNNYDILDDSQFISTNYQDKFEFYKITHALVYKKEDIVYRILAGDSNYKLLYEDDDFALFEKLATPDVIVSYSGNQNIILQYEN